MYDEKSVISRCKKNDKQAYMELFKQYERYLYKLCHGYLQNEQDTLDTMQEIYIKVYKNMSVFDAHMPFLPWLRRIAVNTCLNCKRGMKTNIVSINEKSEDDLSLEDRIPSDVDIEGQIEREDFYRNIRQHLDTLSPKQRMVIVLRYYEDMSYEEIANLLKQPMGTVKTDLFRARNALKDKLQGLVLGQ